MAKYIPLDAVLAEIEKLVDLRKFKTDYDSGYRNGGNAALNNLKERINSIKAKEVDINKEISQFIDANFEKATIGHKLSLRRVAKHFFDLGMRVSNPITAEDRGMAEEIIVNLKRVEQDYKIDLTKEIEWLRNKIKKGE